MRYFFKPKATLNYPLTTILSLATLKRTISGGSIPRLNFPPRYNVAPTDQIPIVRIDPRDGERELVMGPLGSHPILDERETEGSTH
jgi:putative SOS response-associated peptidase YedK